MQRILCSVSLPGHPTYTVVTLDCPPSATVRWVSQAAAALCSSPSGTHVPSSVTLASTGEELPPNALISQYSATAGAASSRSSSAPLITVHLGAPNDRFIPFASLRSHPGDPPATALAAAAAASSSSSSSSTTTAAPPSESPRTLLSVTNQRGPWASAAFAASGVARGAAAALVAGEKALARKAAQGDASRTEGGLEVLLAPLLQRGSALLAEMGPDANREHSTHKMDTLWSFMRVGHLWGEEGGVEGDAGRAACRATLVEHLGILSDLYRYFSVPVGGIGGGAGGGAGAEEGFNTGGGGGGGGGGKGMGATLLSSLAYKPLNSGQNGKELGMGLTEWVSLIDSLGLIPHPLARTAVEGFFQAANSEQEQFRALGGDDNDQRSLSFSEFLEAWVLMSDTCYAMDRDPAPLAGGGKGGLLGPLGAVRHLIAEAALPLGNRIGLKAVRDALRSRPLLALVSGGLGVLEGVFGYYGVPAWAERDRRRVAAEYRRRGGGGLPLLLPPDSSSTETTATTGSGSERVGKGGGEKSAAAVPPFSSHTLGLAMLDSPGLFINPSRVVGGCAGVVGDVKLVDPQWAVVAALKSGGQSASQQQQQQRKQGAGGEGGVGSSSSHSQPASSFAATATAAAAATTTPASPTSATTTESSPTAAANTRPPTSPPTAATTTTSPPGKKTPVKGAGRMTAKEAKEAAEKKAAAAAAAKAAAIPPKVFIESEPRFIDLETFTEILIHSGLYTPLETGRGGAPPPPTPAAGAAARGGGVGAGAGAGGGGDPRHHLDIGGDNHSVVSQGTTTSSALAAAAAMAIAAATAAAAAATAAAAAAAAGGGAGGAGGGGGGSSHHHRVITTIDSGAALEGLTGRKAGKGERRQVYPAPGILTERELARSFWVARVCPTPGTRGKAPPGLPLPSLCEAVARAAAFKWAPLVGIPLGWAGECSDSEFEAWLLASGRVLEQQQQQQSGVRHPFGGGVCRVAGKPLPPALRPLVLQQLVEWGVKAVMNLGGHLGEGGGGGVPPLAPHLVKAGNFCVASLDPLVAVEVAEAWAAGGGGDTPLLNDMLRNGVALPGRPTHAPALNLLPPARDTALEPEDVGVGVGVGGKPKWKPKDAFSFAIPS